MEEGRADMVSRVTHLSTHPMAPSMWKRELMEEGRAYMASRVTHLSTYLWHPACGRGSGWRRAELTWRAGSPIYAPTYGTQHVEEGWDGGGQS